MTGSEIFNRAARRLRKPFLRLRKAVLLCVATLALPPFLPGAQPAQPPGSQAQQQTTAPAAPQSGSAQPDPGPRRPWTNPSQLAVPGQTAAPNVEALNAERKKQISADSAQLLKLAIDLKAEVDKTTKDTLSIGVVRKADAIEKLAHAVKEQTRLAAGPN